MKKVLIWVVVITFVSSMILIGAGCREEVPETTMAEETTAAETTAAPETTAAETTAAETTAADTGGDEIDPWIKGLWDEVEQYRGELDPNFKGPNGETVTWDKDSLPLTVSEVEQVREGNYTVGLPWASLQGDYFAVWSQGTYDACEYLNLEIVAETDAGFDPAKQKSDIESMMPLNPDVLIAAPTDATTGAESFRPAVDAGILVSIVSVIPNGYVRGEDYIGCSTANAYGMGITACDLALDVFGEGGKIGFIYWAQEYWFTNYHDQVFAENVVSDKYGLEIIEEQEFLSPDDAYNAVSAIILNNPDIEGFYVSYMVPAIAAAEACVAAGRDDIKIITGAYDLPTLVNMAQGGNIAGIFTDTTYLVGVNSVLVAAYGLLGKEGPEYTVCPSLPLTPENVREVWSVAFKIPMPPEVDQALTDAGY